MSSGYANGMECVFEDPQLSFQLLRGIGYSSTGGADIGECLSTAYRINESDIESWYSEWYKTASRLEVAGDAFIGRGHNQSAREAYLRASNYYRTAEFFLHINPEDSRILNTWSKSRDCFLKAANLSKAPIVPVRIPFENTSLPGYLCLVDDSGKKRPLLIVQTGFDGTGEELYLSSAQAALDRGYNCLIFEGPGQGEVVRVQKLPFRPDWETVVTPVVDFALQQDVVDPDRIALMGISFGGYLAPRAVAYEHRIKACIANGGVYDFYENSLKKSPPGTGDILDDQSASQEFDEDVKEAMRESVDLGWVFGHGMYVFGSKTPSEFLRMQRPYNMKDAAPLIRCNMLVVDSEGDQDMPGQAKELYDALNCPKEYMIFTAEEGAEEHCQMGATMISNERIFNWLDETL